MANPYKPVKMRSGTLLQAGIPTRRPVEDSTDPRGLLMRGVVTATYLVDDPGHPFADSDIHTPMAVYCDVLAYGRVTGVKFIPKALVSQDLGAMQRGRVWKPRATTRDVSGNALQEKTNPWEMDGDHVLVGFMEENFSQPVILRGIPHPKTDVGQEQEALAGHRLRLKVADGDPDFWKHRGAFYGVSDGGDFEVDLTQAYAADLAVDGKQPAAPGGGVAGNYKVRIPVGSKLTVQIAGGASLELDLKDANAKLKLGDGAVAVAVADHLETLYTTAVTGIKAAFDGAGTGHVHATGTGPSGPPSPTATMPAWDSNINSNKMEIPDT